MSLIAQKNQLFHVHVFVFHLCVNMYVCMYVFMNVYVYIYIYIYIYNLTG
jgi:hypothetical protein